MTEKGDKDGFNGRLVKEEQSPLEEKEKEEEGGAAVRTAGGTPAGQRTADESGDRVSLDSNNSRASQDSKEEIALHLSQLVGSYDTHSLTEACHGLTESMNEVDEACLQLLLERDVVGVIVRLIEELPTHHELQKMFCDILLQCNERVELRTAIDDHKAYRAVLGVLKRHRDRPDLLGKALQTLASIASTTMSEEALREEMVSTTVLALLRDHPDHQSVQIGGLQSLYHLLKSDSYAAATVVLQEDHKLILDALERYPDSPVIAASSLNVLEVVGGTDKGMTSLLNGLILDSTVDAVRRFARDPEVIAGGCGVINILSAAGLKYQSTQFHTGLEQNQVTELLVTILQQFSSHLIIQVSALSALGHILLLLPLLSLHSLNSYNLLRLIHTSFETHGTESDLQEACCRCLARLMEKNPDLHHFIGRNSPKIQFPLHDFVWLVLLEQTKNASPEVFQSVSLALYYIAVDSEVLHGVLLEKGAAVAVLEGVREFLHEVSHDELSVEYGCRALVALIMQNCSESEKKYLCKLNIVEDITCILDTFRYDPGVISEVFGVIACLSSLTVFVESIGSAGIHRQILKAMKQYIHHAVLVESGLEVIIVLSQNKEMSEKLNGGGGALDCVAGVMKHHIASPPIQRKGCLVVRLLSSAEHLTSQSLCLSLARAVVGALTHWKTNPEVEVEALVSVHKLCLTSELMARELVRSDLHLLLFTMMYDWREEEEAEEEEEEEDERGGTMSTDSTAEQDKEVESERDFVLRVGTDILFSLACVHDFKQEMLSSAVRDGLLEGVRVLVEDVGADVNKGGGGGDGGGGGGRSGILGVRGKAGQDTADHTPICLAVLSKEKAMVELLLDLGVTNIHPALRLARDMEIDDITGLLLKSICLDRNGETVNLSGLELQTLKPQWILPCLGVNDATLRRGLQRRRSFDRIKDLLMRRKSIGCIEDNNLDLLRTQMENLLVTNGHDVVPVAEETTGEELEGRDEPDSAVLAPPPPPPAPAPPAPAPVLTQSYHDHRTRQEMPGPRYSDDEEAGLNTTMESYIIPPQPRRSDGRSKSVPPEGNSSSADPPPLPLSIPSTPSRVKPGYASTPVRLRIPSGPSTEYQPTLPPICGTPVGSLHRFSIHSSQSGEVVDSPTSPLVPVPLGGGGDAGFPGSPRMLRGGGGEPGERRSSHGTLVVSAGSKTPENPQLRTPQRRHHKKLNSLMIQQGTVATRQLLPLSTTSPVPPLPDEDDAFEELSLPIVSPAKKGSNLSPSVLLRRVSIWKKKQAEMKIRKRSATTAGSFSSRPTSPPAKIFTDLTIQTTSGESRDSTPVPSDVRRPRTFGRIFTDEGIGTGPTPITAGGASGSSRLGAQNGSGSHAFSPLSPGSDTTDGGGADRSLFSPNSSSTAATNFRVLTHRRRKSSSSLSSSSLSTGVWSDDSRSGLTDNSLLGFVARDSTFSSQPTYSQVREKITAARMVKVLDLSSNSLPGLEEMIGEGEQRGGGGGGGGGGEVERRGGGGGGAGRYSGREERERGEIVCQRLQGLHRLDLKQNQLRRLPRSLMKKLKKLVSLNLSCNVFEELLPECVLSPALISLDLSTNKIRGIPDLPNLPNLTKIVLSDNLLSLFPASINGDSLPHLRFLSLRSNKITDLVKRDLRLRDLEELYLSKNSIREVPDVFLSSMLSLKILDLSHNQLEILPGERAEDLVELATLRVGHNKLGLSQAEFNHFITSAPVLRTLDATENDLSLLPPPRVWKSCGLKDLRLNGNAISELDLDKCEKFWPHLETLYIGQNRLKELPKEIGQLRTLNCLDISHNDIRHLPDELGLLDHLFLLNLQGLTKLSLDPSLLRGPTKNITAFLKSRRVKSVPYYQMKLMMVGGPGRGKTTLLHQLLQEKFSSGHSRSSNIATLGVSVKQWSYVSDSKTCYINCWDFAGQEEFYSTHQCFLTCRSIYLVVYDISKGESELSCLIPWLLNVQARAPSSPVIVIGTHIDKIEKDQYDFRRLQMRTRIQDMCRRPGFPGNLNFAEVDCYNDKMMATLRRKVKECIGGAQLRGQKIMGGLVPHNYVLLSEVVQQEKKRLVKTKSRFPVLTSEKLHSIMFASKLKMDKTELEQAIRFLHESGVLLHYPDVKSNLGKLYFLEPEWLCSLMAQVVTVAEVNPLISTQGLLQVRSLHHLLKEPKFPSAYMKEYICLLERFEVVLSQSPQSLLIPSHLPKMKPSSVSLPPASPGSQIIRRYLFLYIPPGFWPRLVARLITFPKRTLPHYIKGNLEGKLEVWSEGVYYFWSEQIFFLVEGKAHSVNTLDIVVPKTMVGTKLLCSVVDNIEHLIDEWFPGLRDIDTATGRDLVCPLALCPLCPVSGLPHCFLLSDLQEVSTNSDYILCPEHGGKVLLEQLAPDIVISDLDSKFKVLPAEFSVEESPANLLGSGGFGAVFKAMYRGKAVAVKVFSDKAAKINNTTSNYLLRLEVSILSQLEHPHIISLIGVCMRPKPMMLLEYAQLGSLKSLYPYNLLTNQLKHRIALQVASALAYLHKLNIIYRDLKADNVLIFSLSLVAKVNAKLSDYGIACTATETGLTQPIGTRGCKAPELLKAPSSYTPYNEKVDIYSYGLLMFKVMSNGHKPHEELTDPYEIDKAIEEGRPIKGLEQYGCPPWPDMEDLVTHCLHYLPHGRPSAQQIFDRLCSPEFICLKRAVQMAYDCNMETIALRTFRDKTESSRSVEVWMASTMEQQTMLSIVNLSERLATPKGFMIPQLKVYCMTAVQTSHVLLGTDSGHILVYDGYSRKKSHQFSPLHDPVLCLQFFKCSSLGSYTLYAGLANGKMAIYDEYLIPMSDAKPSSIMELGTGPIRNITQHHHLLYVSCGPDVVVIETPQHNKLSTWTAVNEPNSYVTCVELSEDVVWTAHNRSSLLRLWDTEDTHLHRGEVNCDTMLRALLPTGSTVDSRGSRITSMLLQPHPHNVMWVGLGSGQLLLLSATSRNPLMVVCRHVDSIRSLRCQKVPMNDKTLHLILSAGFGFKQRPGESTSFKGTPEMYGNLLVWDAIMPRLKSTFEDIQRQQELYR